MWTAFADPRREKPMWATPEGRAKLDEYGRCCRAEANNGHGSGSHTAERYWWPSYQRTRDAVDDLSMIGDSTDSGGPSAAGARCGAGDGR